MVLYKASIRSFYIYKWTKLQHNEKGLDRDAEIRAYAKLYIQLLFSPKFLTDYANLWLQGDDYNQRAINLLLQAKRTSQTTEIYELLGSAQFVGGNYDGAIESYSFLSNFVPSKFVYQLHLMESYSTNGELQKAKSIANKILTMPIKVQSQQVEEIENIARTTLSN